MTNVELLELVSLNLSLTSKSYSSLLQHDIEVAKAEIEREGIHLTESVSDGNLIVMYASYLFRKRMSDEQGMPRMLRYALNNRLFSEKARA